MTKRSKSADTQADEKKRAKSKRNRPQVEAVGGQAGLPAIPNPMAAASYESLEAQTSRLGDPRLQTGQRQALATRIGRLQGNQHLQRVAISLKDDQKTGPVSDRRLTSPPTLVQHNPGMRETDSIQRAKEEVEKEEEEGAAVQPKRENGQPDTLTTPQQLTGQEMKEIIQRKTDKDNDGSEFLEMTIPDGTYALEAANIKATFGWKVEYGKKFTAYGTASQYTPRHINGLNAAPHELRNTATGVDNDEFRIKPGPELEPAAGEGSAKMQGFRHNRVLSDERVLEAYVRFDTAPLLEKAGDTEFVSGNVIDMDPTHHDYITVEKGSKIGKELSSTISVSDGVAFSSSRTVSTTIGAEMTQQLGAEIGIEGLGKLSGSQEFKSSIEQSVSKTIGTTLSHQIQKSKTVKTSYQFDKPGDYAIVPTCKVWKTPVTVNTVDDMGKITGKKSGNLYTVIYNETGSTVKVTDGKIDVDSAETSGKSSSSANAGDEE